MNDVPPWDGCDARSDYDTVETIPVLRIASVEVFSKGWRKWKGTRMNRDDDWPDVYMVCRRTPIVEVETAAADAAAARRRGRSLLGGKEKSEEEKERDRAIRWKGNTIAGDSCETNLGKMRPDSPMYWLNPKIFRRPALANTLSSKEGARCYMMDADGRAENAFDYNLDDSDDDDPLVRANFNFEIGRASCRERV